MKRYTSEELAAYAKTFALTKFDNAEKVYEKFKSDLNRRMKNVQPALPLPEELERQSRILAAKSQQTLNSIREEAVERRLSSCLKNDALDPGIDINNYHVYFDELADNMAKDAIAESHKPHADEFRAWKKKRKKS